VSTTLITGASSGLGAETARQLAARGHDLALCARRTDRLEALRTEILAAHPVRRVEVRALDVTDDDQVLEVFEGFRDDFGHLDRFVVNAGVSHGAPVGTGGWATNRATVMTNVVAALCQSEVAMQVLRDQGRGQLVMVSSMAALRGLPGAQATYAATKAAVAHLVEGLRVELQGRSDIVLTVLYPGFIESEMNPPTGRRNPLMSSTEKGVAAMVAAMEKQVGSACVPALPWAPLSVLLRHAPISLLRRLL